MSGPVLIAKLRNWVMIGVEDRMNQANSDQPGISSTAVGGLIAAVTGYLRRSDACKVRSCVFGYARPMSCPTMISYHGL